MSKKQTDSYFPETLSDVCQQWYSSNLLAMNEPSLYALKDSTAERIYRFLWIGFNKPPLCIRIDQTGSGPVFLTVKRTDGKGGFTPGKLALNQRRDIGSRELDQLKAQLDAMNYWSLPTKEKLPVGTDGEEWIFEVLEAGQYHLVDRWCPETLERDRPIVDLGNFMLRLAQINF